MSLSDVDISDLKSGWKLGFGDDDEFIDRFFSLYDSDETRHVYRNHEGRIVAQMHCFVFDDHLCNERGCYIYGVTTLPEHRGHGHARTMIKECLESMRENGVAYAVLIAENESLRKWYETLGFTLRRETIAVHGTTDGMNFAMEDTSLNMGMYHLLKPGITDFTHDIKINAPVK